MNQDANLITIAKTPKFAETLFVLTHALKEIHVLELHNVQLLVTELNAHARQVSWEILSSIAIVNHYQKQNVAVIVNVQSILPVSITGVKILVLKEIHALTMLNVESHTIVHCAIAL